MPRGRESGHSGPDSRGRNAGPGLEALGDPAMPYVLSRKLLELLKLVHLRAAQGNPLTTATPLQFELLVLEEMGLVRLTDNRRRCEWIPA